MSDEEQEPQTKPNLEVIRGLLGSVQEQIRFADSKAAFFGLLHTILFGFVASQVDALSKATNVDRNLCFWAWAVLLASYALCSIWATILAIRSVMPRLGENVPGRHLHFAHIAAGYGNDYARFCKEIIAIDECGWATDLGTQVVINSGIAKTKHYLVARAARWTIAAVILWALMLTATMFVTRHEAAAPSVFAGNVNINKSSTNDADNKP